MAQFQLHFVSSAAGPELVRTEFEHAICGQIMRSTRGKSEGAFSRTGTFQWTPAVRALCILVLRTKAAKIHTSSAQRPVLQSMSRGAVSALDYAISRRAAWINDMFGTDSQGSLLARRLFKRSNPERKRPGPLAISLNERFLPLSCVEILRDGKLVDQVEELQAMASRLIGPGEWDIAVVSNSRAPGESSLTHAPSLQELRPSYQRELSSMLRCTNIFSPRALRKALQELQATPALHDVHSHLCAALEELDLKLAGSERLGLALKPNDLEILFPGGRPITFGVTPSQVGTLALLRFLRDVRKLPIEIDYSFAHTSDLAKGVDSGGDKNFPECCVMTTASYAMLNRAGRAEYRPLMVMPAATHSIMGASEGGAAALTAPAEYHFLSDIPTTPSFWFETLQRSGVISASRSRSVHADPDETLSALRSKDSNVRAILWFPYNIIASSMTEALALLESPVPGAGLSFIQNMLFVHQSFAKNQRKKLLLNMLIRDSWMRLLEDAQQCATIVNQQLEEEEYRRKLWRYSGLYRFEQQYAA